MELHWFRGTGPATTQELADEIEAEGYLGKGGFYYGTKPRRCLWGVIEDWGPDLFGTPYLKRKLTDSTYANLINNSIYPRIGLTHDDNDMFKGSERERCLEMARRMRAIP